MYTYILVDSSFEREAEGVEGGFPSHDPSGPAFARGIECPNIEVDAFEGGLRDECFAAMVAGMSFGWLMLN